MVSKKKIFLSGLIKVVLYIISFFLVAYLSLVLTVPLFSVLRNQLPDFTGMFLLMPGILIFFIVFVRYSHIRKACDYMLGVKKITISTRKIIGLNFKKYEYIEIKKDYGYFINGTLYWFAGLIALCILVLLSVSSYYSSKVRAEMSVLQEKGIPTSLKDFHRGIQDDENAYPSLYDAGVRFGELWGKIENRRIVRTDIFTNEWTRDEENKVFRIIRQTKPELKKIIKILDKYKYWEPIDMLEASKNPMGAAIPRFANYISINNLLCLNALIQAKKGNYSRAWYYIGKGIRFLKLIEQHPSLIGMMIAKALQTRISITALTILSLNESVLLPEVLKKQLSEIRDINMLSIGFRAEIANFSDIYLYLREEMGVLSRYMGFLEVNHIETLSYFAGVVENLESGMTYKEIYDEYLKRADIIENSPAWPFLLSKIAIPAYTGMCKREYESDTYSQMVLLVNKIRKHKTKEGRYPENLAELISGRYVKGDDIKDVFNGEKLIYKINKDHLLLYSVGGNLEDDDGDFNEDADVGVIIKK